MTSTCTKRHVFLRRIGLMKEIFAYDLCNKSGLKVNDWRKLIELLAFYFGLDNQPLINNADDKIAVKDPNMNHKCIY